MDEHVHRKTKDRLGSNACLEVLRDDAGDRFNSARYAQSQMAWLRVSYAAGRLMIVCPRSGSRILVSISKRVAYLKGWDYKLNDLDIRRHVHAAHGLGCYQDELFANRLPCRFDLHNHQQCSDFALESLTISLILTSLLTLSMKTSLYFNQYLLQLPSACHSQFVEAANWSAHGVP